MFESLKNKIITFLTVLSGILGLVLFWRLKKDKVETNIAASIEDQKKIDAIQNEIDNNNKLLEQKELERKQMESGQNENISTDVNNVIDFFNKRK